MHYDVMFFDFDGTLVDSVDAKRRAFFDLFPRTERYAEIVEKVLRDDPDSSRYIVIPRIVEAMEGLEVDRPITFDPQLLIEQYGEAVLREVRSAPELPGATSLLESLRLAGVKLFLSSNTPRDALMSLVESRGWKEYFVDTAGYPQSKDQFVRETLESRGAPKNRAAFVGDGVSDERAAKSNGIDFLAIRANGDLRRLASILETLVDV